MFQNVLLLCDVMHAPGMHCIELCNVLKKHCNQATGMQGIWGLLMLSMT